MENIITYAETCLDTFDQRPFCDVDSLVLSCLAYLDIPAALANGRTWRGMPPFPGYPGDGLHLHGG